MAAPERPYDHAGPWSEDEFLTLPVDQRVELVDGSLLVSPMSAHRHQWLAFGIQAALNAAAPDRIRALGPVNLRLAPDRILIPDVAVLRGPRRSAVASPPEDVLLVVEIVSPGHAVMDRVFKPQLYARAGIRSYLRVELEASVPSGHLYRLDADTYREVAAGPYLELDDPFPVVLDLAALDDLEE